jgi:hypothetical protein
MSQGLDLLAGRLTLRPNSPAPIACERPMVGATLMRRLSEGRRAGLLPELIASIFSLCASAQRSTSRRAIAAALGLKEDAAHRAADAQLVCLSTAREHLQRFALDLPRLLPRAGIAVDPGWLRDAPVLALPASGAAPAALQAVTAALPGWLERRLLGLAPATWLQRWRDDPLGWLTEWSSASAHPLGCWLAAVRDDALAIAWPCRPLSLLDEGEAGLRALAATLEREPDFAERPLWHGEPAESGPWTRAARPQEAARAGTAWFRLGARVADLAAIAVGAADAGRPPGTASADAGPLACGALALAPGEGIAWTEMSRGLLMHWVRLEQGARQPDTARVAVYRVLAPTEWNFHPRGALGLALAEGRLAGDAARLAALALDPCISFDVSEPSHA